MGSVYSTFHSLFVDSQVPMKTLIIGLDAAGKTTILNRLNLGEPVTTIPTIGYNIETIPYNGLTLIVWEACGRNKIPHLHLHYFNDIIGLIFVVDSNDAQKLSQVNKHLWRAQSELDRVGLSTIPLLVYANKQDLQSSLSVAEVSDALNLTSVKGRDWHIQGACALKGEGLQEGLDWYIARVMRRT